MCANEGTKRGGLRIFNILLMIALPLGILCGFLESPSLHAAAQGISDMIINALKLLSLPMIFLSVISTISGMHDFGEIRQMGRRVVGYALLTTALAALVGLSMFEIFDPVSRAPVIATDGIQQSPGGSYFSALVNLVPSNFFQAFLENNVIGVMLMAVVMGLAILSLKHENKLQLHSFFSSLFSAVLKVTYWLITVMPIAVWAFVTLLTHNLLREHPEQLSSLIIYIVCIFAANLIQAFVVLPLLAKSKGLKPLKLMRGALPALTIGFFTRSSNAALPITLNSAQNKLGLSRRVSNFSLPLCSTINMNGCAAFIIITVLYVAGSHGVVFSLVDLALWVVIATLAAVGNAGVPMGCYFLSSALLASMNVPLTLLGMILPIYTFIDMFETGVNIWSDICVTAIVDKELAEPAEDLLEGEAV